MKIRYLNLLLFFIIGSGLCYSEASEKDTKREIYKSERYGFSVIVPPTWKHQEINQGGVAVILVSKYKVKNFYPSLNIRVEPANNIKLDDLVKKVKEDIEKGKKTLKHIYKSIEIYKSEMKKVGGVSAFEMIVDTMTVEGDDLRSISVFLINDNRIYNLVGQSPKQVFESYGHQFRDVINSFAFK